MRPRFREGEVVSIIRAPVDVARTGGEAVVQGIAGPNEAGTGWIVTLRLREEHGGDSLIALEEADLDPTGLEVGSGGEPVPIGRAAAPEERVNCLELRLFTEIADGAEADRVAGALEHEIAALLGGASVATAAERHWSAPHNYELTATVLPGADPIEALQILVEAGGEGWLGCRDDGWRCDLWWSASRDPDAMLIVPEVHGAEVAFVPWSSPVRRSADQRPLVAITADDHPPEESPRRDEV